MNSNFVENILEYYRNILLLLIFICSFSPYIFLVLSVNNMYMSLNVSTIVCCLHQLSLHFASYILEFSSSLPSVFASKCSCPFHFF
jgi:hypothetical protein